jgi:hypothetical protein
MAETTNFRKVEFVKFTAMSNANNNDDDDDDNNNNKLLYSPCKDLGRLAPGVS